MAFANGKLYIANHDAVLAFDYQPGTTSLTGAPKKLMDLPPAGNHWMRNLLLSPDGRTCSWPSVRPLTWRTRAKGRGRSRRDL
jgi:glucose/arabinose dehydrogenase